LKKFAQGYNKFEEILSVIIFALLVVDVFIGVVWRYALNNSLAWTDELSRILYVWITWIGVSLGEAKNEHIRITMLTDRLPFRVAHAVNLVAYLLTIVISGLCGYYSAFLYHFSLEGSYYVVTGTPYWVGYYAITIGCALYIIRLLFKLPKAVKYIIKGESAVDLDDIEVPSELAGVMSKEDYLEMLKAQKGGK